MDMDVGAVHYRVRVSVLAHVHVPVFESHHHSEGFSIHLVGMWIAFTIGALLITVFIGKVSEALRRQEQEALQFQQRLAHHERLASIATLAWARAAHELGTPLATIAVASRELELYGNETGKDASVVEDARLIRLEVERCSEILRQMSGRGGEPVGEFPTPISLKEICTQVKNGLASGKGHLIDIQVRRMQLRFSLPVQPARRFLRW